MSLKLNAFATIITNPLNIHNFLVDIPGAPNGSIVVASSVFPSEKLREVKLHYQGEEIRYPTIAGNDGIWKVTVPEADSGIVRRELDSLKSKMWNQKTGIFVPQLWKAVTVTARNLQLEPVFKAILHGCWLLGRDQVTLDNSDPTKNWNWDYEFRFQWIEDVDLNAVASPNPLSNEES